ncbi:DUF433 domain-containing protein [Bradyrhizobium jicamae]|uniref:DUF433 domain-containing protein n=1 Tax=Bradyrhizobium jicamae TaxID=280332 RepID=A0ABS5FKS1_9BRAD|nr:DUF433 domain-containing protein [Bradyrhizobium jicamae]MBR0797351.1 DUF433 domain-containing protein [Bradyrhizobium jicamae]
MKTICADWSPIGSGDGFRAILSLRETVVLADVAENAVRKDIEDKVLWPVRFEDKPRFRWVDVFLLAAVYRNHLLNRKMRKYALDRLENCVAPTFRKTNSKCFAPMNRLMTIWERPSKFVIGCEVMELDSYVYLDFNRVRSDLTPRVDLYARGLSRIDENENIFGGDAVFKNTRLPVRHIGKLAISGEPIESILEDYPYLDEDDVNFAAIYHSAHPPVGRPRSVRGDKVDKISPG